MDHQIDDHRIRQIAAEVLPIRAAIAAEENARIAADVDRVLMEWGEERGVAGHIGEQAMIDILPGRTGISGDEDV